MIASFRDSETRELFEGNVPRGFPQDLARRAHRKLVMIHAAISLEDLRTPPANHLEKLVGDREGQYSIRINQRWRICFEWTDDEAHGVEVVDYH